jgi:DNA-binding CsgD family transcriptional regulator
VKTTSPCPARLQTVSSHAAPQFGSRSLTSREREIFKLIAAGHPSKQIADALKISVNTVNNHRAAILAKLSAHSAIEALRICEHLE